ncbi:MAG: DoxX family protein [Acidobacteriota bacterium]
MTNNSKWARIWAAFFARWVLGLIFFMAGVYKVFEMGATVHASTLFVEPYRDTFLPVWSLWLTGTLIPFVELIGGALLIVGWRIHEAALALGSVLVVVTFGHLLMEPLYAFNRHVFPRLILLIIVLVLHDDDRFCLDRLLASS